ncbi:hypothetical protein ACFFRR_007345 [Megaselia abdita]
MGTTSNEYTAPEWLTREFLLDLLRNHFKNESLEIKELVVKKATISKNSGFASELHRASLIITKDGKEEKFSLIVKDHPKGQTGAIAKKSKLFHREIVAYKEIIPRVNELLHSIGDNTKITPTCFYTTETPEPFLILEDMTTKDFNTTPTGYILNMDFVLPTVTKLAKFHAASVILAQNDSSIMDSFREAPISRNPDRKEFLGFFPASIRYVAEEVCTWKGYEEIAEKLFALSQRVLIDAVDMYEQNDDGFKVLNTADLWVNNLMFHYDEQKEPDDVVLLDFQLAYFGSPAVDLNYFLFGSFNENIRKVHYKYVIREYQKVLKDTLEKLNYIGHIPTLKELSIEIINYSLQSVIASICLTPLVFTDSDGGFENLEELTRRSEEGELMRRENIQNPRYKAYLQRTLKEFELSGFLD